jgi:hypothetical protein
MQGADHANDMNGATEVGVYETYEEFHGRKSTLDELVADIAKFDRQSMLWVCGVIITGMQLWDRLDRQPPDVFLTLIRLYFDKPFHRRLLIGFWSKVPRRVLFHRRQMLLIAKLAIKHCADGRVNAMNNAQMMGDILLKANDQLAHGLLEDLPKTESLPSTKDELSRFVAEMLAMDDDGSVDVGQMLTRCHLMQRRFVQELQGHSDWIDLAGEYEQVTGLTLEEYEAMALGVHSRFGFDLSKALYRDAGTLPLKDANFSATAIPLEKVRWFLDSVSAGPVAMAKELASKDYGANDATIFRKYPMVLQYYNMWLTTAWCGFLMMDNGFLLEKVMTGPYWNAVAKYGQRLHRFWGEVFESYVHELMKQATAGTSSAYLADPRSVIDNQRQLCDGVLRRNDCLVLMEYKGAVFRADTKYSGNHVALTAEIEKKLVHDHQSGNKKGVEQLAEAVKTLLGADGPKHFPHVSIDGIKRIYLYIVTLDSVGGTIGLCTLLNVFLDDLLDREAYPPIKIMPVYCSEVSALEGIAPMLGKHSLAKILEHWYQTNGELFLPLRALSLPREEWGEKDWRALAWDEIWTNAIKILFPNEAPKARPKRSRP